ncbi:hypothetical protein RJZ90_003984 [Blastomyces dermatitidis]
MDRRIDANIRLSCQYGSTTGINDEIALKLTEEQKRRMVIGTKCLLAGWCLYVTLIWCLKACMLFLFNRLTRSGRLIHILVDVASINLGTIWSIRETFVAIIAVNVPVLKPLFTKTVRLATTSTGRSAKTTTTGTHELTRIQRKEKQNRIRIEMGLTTMDDNSEERIVQSFDPNSKNNDYVISAGSIETLDRDDREPAEIHVTTTYNVSQNYA